jgi:diguanylate cyclase (GGDEF)-like protein
MITEGEILSAKVLVVDDQELMVCMLKEMLEQAGHTDVSYTKNPFEVCELHRVNQYKVILLDLQMPGKNGFQVMKELNAIALDDYVPVIAITCEPAYKLAALKSGARDFIAKPFLVEEALTRIRNMLEIRLLHEAARRALTTMEILSLQDPLTGLGNRRSVAKRIAAALANARRHGNAMAVVYLDLDGFKQINDTLGHSAGDAVLVSVARRLKSVVREEDTIARVGGDEFMIALWQVKSASDVSIVAAKLINILSQHYVVDGQTVAITTSAGISIYPTDAHDVDSLIKNADAALYKAKREGKNAYRIAEAALSKQWSIRTEG